MRRLKKLWLVVTSFWPLKLPQGMSAFNSLVEDVAELSGLPQNDKLKKVISLLILQLPPTTARVPKRLIVKQIQKAAANQVAAENLQRLQELENSLNNETKESHCIN